VAHGVLSEGVGAIDRRIPSFFTLFWVSLNWKK
jgi:hypothetical protein